MAEINLLQGEKRSALRMQVPNMTGGTGKVLLWVLAGLVALELGGWGILYTLKSKTLSQVQEVEQATQAVNSKLAGYRKDAHQAILAQGALQSFAGLLDKHLYWTQLWNELAKFAYKPAQFLSLQATVENNQFTLRGVVPTYTDLAKVILGLQQSEKFSSVDLIETGAGEGQVVEISFGILIRLKPTVLQRTEAQATIPEGAPIDSETKE